LLKQVKSDCQ